MRSVCVYCGSSTGKDHVYVETAIDMGKTLAKHGLDLVYGGGNIGIMGIVADSTLNSGGRAIGVIPQALVDREIAHQGLTELHITDDMHQRKSKMAELSDAFIALPGGLGTLEEIFEIWTWNQLGLHKKPIALLNTKDYYSGLLHFLDNAVEEGFIKEAHRHLVIVNSDPQELVMQLKTYVPIVSDKLSDLRPQ